MKFVLFLLLILALTKAEDNVDLNLDVDKTGWVDLLDPFSSELYGVGSAQTCDNSDLIAAYQKRIEDLISANELLKSKKSESVDVLLKHVLRQFFVQLNVDLIEGYAVNRPARVKLSESDVNTLLKYLNSQRHSEEVAMREKLRAALESFIVVEEQFEENGIVSALRQILPSIIILNVIFLPFAMISVLRKILGPRQFIGFFMIATFSLSYYFTYIRKYQEVLAERFHRVHNTNDACSAKGLVSEAFGVLLSYVKIKGKDQCLQKYEDMLVEPFLLVDPLQIFGEVVTNFMMSPFSVIGVHLNKFFNDFFIDTPIFLVAVKLIFMVLVLFYLSGYRLTSFFVTIEPGQRAVPNNPHIEQVNQSINRVDRVIEQIDQSIDYIDHGMQRPSRTLERPAEHSRSRALSL